MEQLLDIILRLLDLFPRFKAISPDEGGVTIRLGKYVKTLGNGYYWYWPVITEIRIANVTRNLIDVEMQDVTTKDGKPLTINMSIEYTVKDVKKALLNVLDFDENLQEIAGNSMREAVGRVGKLQIDVDDLAEEVLGYITKDARQYGIKVIRVLIPTVTYAKPIRIIQ